MKHTMYLERWEAAASRRIRRTVAMLAVCVVWGAWTASGAAFTSGDPGGLPHELRLGWDESNYEPETILTQVPFPNSNRSIFQRFVTDRDVSKTWQTLFEVPVGLIPQTEPGAHVTTNSGLNWVTSYQPLNRVYFGRSIGYAHMAWQPGGRLDSTDVVEWTWTEILNIAVQSWWVISIGAGAGFMDGLIFYKDGTFKHRFEVFMPLQIGTGVRLGKTWFLDAKFMQSSYFGPGPVASAARTVVGLGYNY